MRTPTVRLTLAGAEVARLWGSSFRVRPNSCEFGYGRVKVALGSLLLVGCLFVQTGFAQIDLSDSTEAERNFQTAAALQNRLLFELAIPRWEKVLVSTDDPSHLRRARKNLIVCYFYAKHYKQAITLAEAVLKENPAKEDAATSQLRRQTLIYLVASHLHLDDKMETAKSLQRLEAEFPDAVESAKELGKQTSPRPNISLEAVDE